MPTHLSSIATERVDQRELDRQRNECLDPRKAEVLKALRPVFDTCVKMSVLPGEDDMGGRCDSAYRTADVRITFTDDTVTVHGLGLYPLPIERWRVGRLEAFRLDVEDALEQAIAAAEGLA